MKKLLAAWLCVALVACAASRSNMAARPEANTAGAPAPMPSDPHAEIEQLSAQIDQQRTQMNLPAPTPAPVEPMATHAQPPAPVCTPVSQTCKDTCTIGDSICKNSDSICKIADGLPGDDWAAGKCSTAKQTCSDAHKRCCECS